MASTHITATPESTDEDITATETPGFSVTNHARLGFDDATSGDIVIAAAKRLRDWFAEHHQL